MSGGAPGLRVRPEEAQPAPRHPASRGAAGGDGETGPSARAPSRPPKPLDPVRRRASRRGEASGGRKARNRNIVQVFVDGHSTFCAALRARIHDSRTAETRTLTRGLAGTDRDGIGLQVPTSTARVQDSASFRPRPSQYRRGPDPPAFYESHVASAEL